MDLAKRENAWHRNPVEAVERHGRKYGLCLVPIIEAVVEYIDSFRDRLFKAEKAIIELQRSRDEKAVAVDKEIQCADCDCDSTGSGEDAT